MRVPIRKREPLRSEDSMTPLIDVVFLLLIFFVCASVGQVAESMLPTQLDSGAVASIAAATDSEPAVTKIWVYLKREAAGTLSLKVESRTCASFAELNSNLRELAKLTPESPVILDIGPEVPLEALVDTWDICNRAGFESINFATKRSVATSP